MTPKELNPDLYYCVLSMLDKSSVDKTEQIKRFSEEESVINMDIHSFISLAVDLIRYNLHDNNIKIWIDDPYLIHDENEI